MVDGEGEGVGGGKAGVNAIIACPMPKEVSGQKDNECSVTCML